MGDGKLQMCHFASGVSIVIERVHNILHKESNMNKRSVRQVPRLLTVDWKREREEFQGKFAVALAKSTRYSLSFPWRKWIHYSCMRPKIIPNKGQLSESLYQTRRENYGKDYIVEVNAYFAGPDPIGRHQQILAALNGMYNSKNKIHSIFQNTFKTTLVVAVSEISSTLITHSTTEFSNSATHNKTFSYNFRQ